MRLSDAEAVTVTLHLKDPETGRIWERVEIPEPFYRQIKTAAKQMQISVPRFFEDAIRATVEKLEPVQDTKGGAR